MHFEQEAQGLQMDSQDHNGKQGAALASHWCMQAARNTNHWPFSMDVY